MSSYLISVSREAAPEVVNVLNRYGDVGYISDTLFAIRSADSADQVRARITDAFPTVSHVLVAVVDSCSYKGTGKIAFAASILNNAANGRK